LKRQFLKADSFFILLPRHFGFNELHWRRTLVLYFFNHLLSKRCFKIHFQYILKIQKLYYLCGINKQSMKLSDAKAQFISSWGAFGTHWGINRTMAQIHALLLISPDPITQDDIMEQLSISRGNVNMNTRDLIGWGLVERVLIPGERKEFFTAEKDIWKVATQIIKERKKRELDPMLKLLTQLEQIEGDKKNKDVKQFTDTIAGIRKFGAQADKVLDVMIKADESWFLGSLLKFFK
jgi:DNA-binding transcriptional regulator GbsR (MarR family)